MAGLLDLYNSLNTPMGLLGPQMAGFEGTLPAYQGMTDAGSAFFLPPSYFQNRPIAPLAPGARPVQFQDISGPTNLPQSFLPQPPQPDQAPETPTDASAARRGMPSFMGTLGLPGPLSVPQTMPRIPPALPQAAAAPSVPMPATPIPTQAANTPPAPTGFLSRLSNGIASHPNMLLAMGAALSSGHGLGGMFTGAMQGGQLDQQQALQQQAQTAIAQDVLARGGTAAEAVAAATNPEYLKAWLGRNVAPRKIELQGGNIISTDASKNTAQTLGAYPTFQKMSPGESGQFVTPGVPGGVGSPTAAPSAQTVVPGMTLEQKNEAEKVGTDFGTDYSGIQKDVAGAVQMKNVLQRMSQLNPQAYEGAAAPAFQHARSLLASFGVSPGAVPAGEEFTALSNAAVQAGLGGKLGTGISNADVAFMSNQFPTLSQTAQGRQQIISMLGQLADRRIQTGQFADQWRKQNGSMAGFNVAMAQYADQHPVFGNTGMATPQALKAGTYNWTGQGGFVPVQ